jgi:hypothetical protein
MKSSTPKPENLAKLTVEQRQVYDCWVKEQQLMQPLIEQMSAALGRGDMAMVADCQHAMSKIIPERCEHDRSIFTHCEACRQIDATLFPEDYDGNGYLIDDKLTVETVLALGSPDKKLN